jgi:redox-sensitive bicupin YhaK (pirin superfamily)
MKKRVGVNHLPLKKSWAIALLPRYCTSYKKRIKLYKNPLTALQMKQTVAIHTSNQTHWVGDGFPVRTLISYQTLGTQLSPFLMLDYAGPALFDPSAHPRGVSAHPHRGFETVTIVYEGEVEHKDSAGNGGTIGPGDVQWMTAGAGILHEEMHSKRFTQEGGTLRMAQLWVNLPAKEKMTQPGYQAILNQAIPAIDLENRMGVVRVIAGHYAGHQGPAKTHTAMNVFDVQVKKGASIVLPAPDGWSAAVVLLSGELELGHASAGEGSVIEWSHAGEGIAMNAVADTHALILSGEPIDEPIVGHGPFVMNTPAEIARAIDDFRQGRFGSLD